MEKLQIYIQPDSRFSEINPSEVESAELAVEDAVSRVLLDLFDEVEVADVNLSFSPSNEPMFSLRVQASHSRTSINSGGGVGDEFTLDQVVTTEEVKNSIERAINKELQELFGEVKVESLKVLDAVIYNSSTLRIQINEEPLTAYHLGIIISAMTELHTKFWLIQQKRFTDIISFSQTHNPRFAEEANLLIGKMAHNSPGWLDFVTASGPFISEALKTVTTIFQTSLQLQATELDNKAKELELRLKEKTVEAELADKNQNRQIDAQRAALENQRGQLELEGKRLELMKKRLEVQEQQLDLEKKRIDVALEIAHKAVDVFSLEIDTVTKSMLAETLLPNILHLGTAKGAKLILSAPSQDDESENAGGV